MSLDFHLILPTLKYPLKVDALDNLKSDYKFLSYYPSIDAEEIEGFSLLPIDSIEKGQLWFPKGIEFDFQPDDDKKYYWTSINDFDNEEKFDYYWNVINDIAKSLDLEVVES
jgi:hypothetical protein